MQVTLFDGMTNARYSKLRLHRLGHKRERVLMKTPDRHSGPLYRQVADDIAAQIAAGTWKAGDKLPSEHALCARYLVSQITVRRALRELAYEDRVYSHHGLGWFVSPKAEPADTVREVTCILPDLDWLTATLIRLLGDELDLRGVGLHLFFSAGRSEAEARALAASVARQTSMIMLAIAGPERQAAQRYSRMLEGIPVPVLLLGRDLTGLKVPAVVLDEGAALQQMTRYLLSLGHRRLAYVGGDPASIEGQRHYRGFTATLWEEGLELPLDWAFGGPLAAEVQAARLRRAFQAGNHPTALVCASDLRAAEAMALLRSLDLQCPDDVAIVGMGDHEMAGWLSTPLTTFRFDMAELARSAAAMAVALLAGRAVEDVHVSGQLVQRMSCGAGFGRTR
jgi:DNA-binding LacI/PurR family transcriptional regulator/DNA-binding transcriptional regulator YhcF (GntR family)